MYVATPQGYRRKIGPRSRYGTTPNSPAYGNGIGPQGPQSAMNRRQRVGSEPQRVGTDNSGLDSHFGSDAMRRRKELDERERADRYLFDQEKRRANQARKSEEAAKTQAQQPSQEAKNAAGVAAYGTGKPPAAGVAATLDAARLASERAARAKQAAADRAKGRAKYEAEKSGGKAPAPTVAAKQPEPRKEATAPATTPASPAKPTVAKAASPAKDEQPSKTTPPLKVPEPEKLAEKPKPKPVPGKVQVASAVNKVVKGTQYAATMPLRNAVASVTAPIRAAKAATDFVSSKVNAAKRWWETGE